MKNRFGNIGLLDLRSATAESIAELGAVENIGLVLVSPETAPLVVMIQAGNIGGTLEASAEAKLLAGQVTLGREFFKDMKAPIEIVIAGQLTIEGDVEPEQIEKFIGKISVAGQLTYPQKLTGALNSIATCVSGQLLPYVSEKAKIINGRLRIDGPYLESLPNGSSIVVNGAVRVEKDIPLALLESKVSKLMVNGKLICSAENSATIYARLVGTPGKITEVPLGHELFERPLDLDNDMLSHLKSKKIFCLNRVVIGDDVTPQALEQRIENIVFKEVVICRQNLRSSVMNLCDLQSTQIVPYEGELWLVDDEMTLNSSRFEFLEGKATIVVNGELRIDPKVEPKVLAANLAKVHNNGEIYCSESQLGALQARLGLSSGEFHCNGDEFAGTGNVGSLKL
jgi:hypothetical protein